MSIWYKLILFVSFQTLLDSIQTNTVDLDIVRVSCRETSFSSSEQTALVKVLMCRVVQLCSASKEAPHPFGIINMPLSQTSNIVKHTMDDLRRKQNKSYCTLTDIYDAIYNKAGAGGGVTPHSYRSTSGKSHNASFTEPTTPGGNSVSERRKQDNMKQIREAVAHWAKVGEVVWFNSSADKSGSSKKKGSSTTTTTGGATTQFFSTAADSDVEFVFLDPEWLLRVLRSVADKRLYEKVASKDVYSIFE